MNLPTRELCTGCEACRNACRRDAISMVADEEGFLQPVVDKILCVHCGVCVRVCPILNLGKHRPAQVNEKKPICGLIRDETIWRQSTSGGAFSGICASYAQGKAVIYGAQFDGRMHVSHSRGDVRALNRFRKSKYIQSEIGLIYRSVRNDLMNGLPVLFSGTPCQVAGLREYLGKNYDGLLCVEFICHGVGSPLVFRRHLDEIERYSGEKIQAYEFRTKYFWPETPASGYNSLINYQDGSIKELHDDAYNRIFIKQLCIRRSCAGHCLFRTTERYADITIADARGERQFNSRIEDSKNRSVILVNTEKGEKILPLLQQSMDLGVYSLEALKNTNPHFCYQGRGARDRSHFWKDFLKGADVRQLAQKYVRRPSLVVRIFRRLKRKGKALGCGWLVSFWRCI